MVYLHFALMPLFTSVATSENEITVVENCKVNFTFFLVYIPVLSYYPLCFCLIFN